MFKNEFEAIKSLTPITTTGERHFRMRGMRPKLIR